MRILIDHSGYELKNIGDLAMLVSTVRRVQRLAPSASISVVTVENSPIAELLPGVEPVLISRIPTWVPERARARGRVRWKRRAKWLSSHGVRFLPSGGDTAKARLASLDRAIKSSDLVIAAGGGYINDSFPAHGRGVLHTLHRAQALGKRTAVFGQGLGPISSSRTMDLAARVLTRVDILTLREGVEGPRILDQLGVAEEKWAVTGDDALHLAAEAVQERRRTGANSIDSAGLGLSLRLASYAGTDLDAFQPVHDVISSFHERFSEAPIVGVPIMSEESESDLIPIRWCVPSTAPRNMDPIINPDQLVDRVASCRALVTGSYHAGVFALSMGVPVVGLSNSKYYDWKFSGLQALYGDQMVQVVALADAAVRSALTAAIDNAWNLPSSCRADALATTMALIDAQDRAYASVVSD